MIKKSIAEIIGTFALVFCGTGAIVIDQETHGGVSHAGVAIPIVSGHLESLWIYLTAPIAGSALAVPTWKYLSTKNE